MEQDSRSEHICSRVRNMLNSDSVKLWLKPYCDEDQTNETEIQQLAVKYSAALKLPLSEVKEALFTLQKHSLSRLREQEQFRASGVSTVRVRISGCNLPEEPSCSKNSSETTGSRLIAVPIMLSDPGRVLLQKVAELSSLPAYRLKLISQGKILEHDSSLQNQGVKNSSQIMAVVLTENPDEVNTACSRHKLLEDTRADVMTLANSERQPYFELQDQKGNELQLPRAEQKALFLAMALCERGRTVMARGDYAMALILFLEADIEFQKCNSALLKSVDNAALLNLDIAWCYLCLRSVSYLPDAQRRLQACQEMLARSYGPNMERVVTLKGSAGNEAVLIMRLHLLQAIVMFHQNKLEDCRRLLTQAEEELKRLKVNDEDLTALISIGYKTSEARMGLRAANGDLSTAEVFIQEWRREKDEARGRNIERRKLEKNRRKLGRCANGENYVEPSFVNTLENMGFDREIAICALAHTNNVISRAVQVIQENPECLQQPKGRKRVRLDPDALQQVLSMGFDLQASKFALKKYGGSVQQAVDALVNGRIDLGQAYSQRDDDNSNSESSSLEDEDAEASQSRREAYERLAPDIQASDDNHLDQTLAAEERFLTECKTLLESIDGK